MCERGLRALLARSASSSQPLPSVGVGIVSALLLGNAAVATIVCGLIKRLVYAVHTYKYVEYAIFLCAPNFVCGMDGWMIDTETRVGTQFTTQFTCFTRKKVQILQKWRSQRRQQQRSPTLAIARPVRRRQFSKASILQVDPQSAHFGTSNERSYSWCSKKGHSPKENPDATYCPSNNANVRCTHSSQ